MAFTGMLCRFTISYDGLAMIACYWKSMYQERKEVNAWNVTVSSIMVNSHWSFVTVGNRSGNFIVLAGETEIVNAEGSDKDWYIFD